MTLGRKKDWMTRAEDYDTYTDPRFPEVRFLLRAEQDDIEVRGNAMASGDADADKEAEDEILARLDQGDVWAWASVEVIARFDYNGDTFEGNDFLGACSYKDAADFTQPGGYWDDMKAAAYDDMREAVKGAVKRGEVAARTFWRLQQNERQVAEKARI